MELFSGITLLRKNGKEIEEIAADEALKDIPVVGLYFSAHWCMPCREYTPEVANFYASMKRKGKAFEIIFVSHDTSEEDMRKYMLECHGDWLAIPYSVEDVKKKLNEKFEVIALPTFIILNDGKMLTNNCGGIFDTNASWDIDLKPDDCYDRWAKGEAAVTEAERDEHIYKTDGQASPKNRVCCFM